MPPIYENPIFELQEIEQSGIFQTQSYTYDRHFKRQVSEEVKGIRSDRNHRHLYKQPPDYQTKFYSGNLGKTHKIIPQTNVCISENWLFATNREEKKHFKTRIRREESTRNHFRTNQDPEFQGNAS